ncbi:MAG: hypothetical protein WC285_05385 [Candidatus Gracilibacteria bacterium]|jgi:hypothetical protein
MTENFSDKYKQQFEKNPTRKPLNQLIHHTREDVISISRMSGKWQSRSIEIAKQKILELLPLISDEWVILWLQELHKKLSQIDANLPVEENDPRFDEINNLVTLIEKGADEQFYKK